MPKQGVSPVAPPAKDAANSVATLGKMRRRTEHLGRVLRDDGPIALLREIHFMVLKRLHAGVLDRLTLSPGPASASQVTQLDGLTIASAHHAAGEEYEPTPRRVIGWVQNLLPRDVANWSFIDVGAGRGRVVAAAASYSYRQVLGVEFAAELQCDARRYISSLKAGGHIACEADVINADAATFEIPAGPCIFYLYNPFGEVVLRKFLANVIASYQSQPRQMLIAYWKPDHSYVMNEFQQISKCELPLKAAFKFAMLSPYAFHLYKIGEA